MFRRKRAADLIRLNPGAWRREAASAIPPFAAERHASMHRRNGHAKASEGKKRAPHRRRAAEMATRDRADGEVAAPAVATGFGGGRVSHAPIPGRQKKKALPL